jgi:hypothetical protein
LPVDPAADSYRLLDMRPNATPEEIHAAYRGLAKAYRQDCYRVSTGSPVRMARVNVTESVERQYGTPPKVGITSRAAGGQDPSRGETSPRRARRA